jgi:site-specific recombinase XerD
MASVKLKFRASEVKGKEGTLYYQVIHQRVIRQIRTGYQLFSWEWDDGNGCIISPDEKYSYYARLKLIIEKADYEMRLLQRIVAGLEADSREYSADDIVSAWHNALKCEISFFGYTRKNVDKLRQLGSAGTADNHQSALNSFMNYRNRQDLPFPMITAGMMEEYEAWLKSRGNCRNTTSFYMRCLRSIYNQAVEDGLATQADIFRHVYTGVDKTIKRAIPMKGIRRIKDLDLTAYPALEIARDLFLFSFYTRGMSFIDMAYLRKKDVTGGTLVYRRHKTGQQLNVRWEKEMQAIVNRYSNPTQYLLPVITKEDGTEYRQYKNAMMLINRRLKKIARFAGISQVLSMYTSRHSWATIARDKNIPLSVISQGLGHENDMNTQIYLASIKTEEIDKANRKIMRDLFGG